MGLLMLAPLVMKCRRFVVFDPQEQSPITGLRVAEITAEIGPNGSPHLVFASPKWNTPSLQWVERMEAWRADRRPLVGVLFPMAEPWRLFTAYFEVADLQHTAGDVGSTSVTFRVIEFEDQD